MARPRRKRRRSYNDPGHAHELTFSCYKRRAFLARDRTRRYLAEAVADARGRHGFDLWAYVVMPEHVHLLIHPTNACYDMSSILKAVKQSAARKAIAYLRRMHPDGLRWLQTGQKHDRYHFWLPGGGYDRNITALDTLLNVVHYIHNNPVRRELVDRPDEWLWSSAREWRSGEPGPIPLDRHSFPTD